ncbi:MAG: hypothetical protein GX587_00430 [Bacteroidales bacterium]|nr:hypothetical protein [Bacteroidales bacterium]
MKIIRFDRIPEKIKDKIFQKVFKIAEYHNLSQSDKQAYEDSLKYYRDLKNSLDTAEGDGFTRAEQLLMPKLEEECRLKEEAMLKLAIRIKRYGNPIDEIMRETGLSREVVEVEGLG